MEYYHEYGYGIDATIYPPENLDLKFVNDSPGPIFIHTYLDDNKKEAYVDFYGIDDGRKVELEQVKNYKFYLDKEVVYSDDLPSGTEQTVKPGRPSRYIEWAWKVSWPDGSVDSRVIETLYPGAPAILRVGQGA